MEKKEKKESRKWPNDEFYPSICRYIVERNAIHFIILYTSAKVACKSVEKPKSNANHTKGERRTKIVRNENEERKRMKKKKFRNNKNATHTHNIPFRNQQKHSHLFKHKLKTNIK